MKHLCLILLFLANLVNTFSQIQTEYWENGKKKSEGKIINGERTGSWKTWYENGSLEWTGEYIDGLLDNEWKYFHQFGLISKTCVWQNGTLKKWTKYLYYKANGLKAEFTFDDKITEEQYIEIIQIDNYISHQQLELIQADFDAEGIEIDPNSVQKYFRVFVYFYQPKISYYSNLKKVLKLDSLRNQLIVDLLREKEINFTYSIKDSLDQVLFKLISNKLEPLILIKSEYYSHTPGKLFSQEIYTDSILQEHRIILSDSQNYRVRYYTNDGKLECTGLIKDGERHGIWKHFDKYENLIKKERYKLGLLKE